jgi:hypothetical protein
VEEDDEESGNICLLRVLSFVCCVCLRVLAHRFVYLWEKWREFFVLPILSFANQCVSACVIAVPADVPAYLVLTSGSCTNSHERTCIFIYFMYDTRGVAHARN